MFGSKQRTPYKFKKDLREVELESNGDLHFSGHDLDRDLKKFVGRDEWEGALYVRAKHVPQVLETLQNELGFGGTIKAMTLFEECSTPRGSPATRGVVLTLTLRRA